jgi:hypothetical protein
MPSSWLQCRTHERWTRLRIDGTLRQNIACWSEVSYTRCYILALAGQSRARDALALLLIRDAV